MAIKSSSEPQIYEKHHDLSDTMNAFVSHSTSKVSLHFHRKIEMLYVIDGQILTTVGDETFAAEPDDIVFVHHYSKHSYQANPYYKKCVLLLSPLLSADFAATLDGATLPALMQNHAVNKPLLAHFDAIINNSENPLLIKGHLNIIFGTLLSAYDVKPLNHSGNSKLVTSLLDYIDRHYDRPITLDSLAAAFGYNRYHISKTWSNSVGQNLSVYVNGVRLQHVIERFKTESDSKIADIAYSCGFDSLTTFYRCFTDKYGISPKQYLKLSAAPRTLPAAFKPAPDINKEACPPKAAEYGNGDCDSGNCGCGDRGA